MPLNSFAAFFVFAQSQQIRQLIFFNILIGIIADIAFVVNRKGTLRN